MEEKPIIALPATLLGRREGASLKRKYQCASQMTKKRIPRNNYNIIHLRQWSKL